MYNSNRYRRRHPARPILITSNNSNKYMKNSKIPSRLRRRIQASCFLFVSVGWVAIWNFCYSSSKCSKSTTTIINTKHEDGRQQIDSNDILPQLIAEESNSINRPLANEKKSDNVATTMTQDFPVQQREQDQLGEKREQAVVDDYVVIPERTPTNHACDGYDGIYHIIMGDIGKIFCSFKLV